MAKSSTQVPLGSTDIMIKQLDNLNKLSKKVTTEINGNFDNLSSKLTSGSFAKINSGMSTVQKDIKGVDKFVQQFKNSNNASVQAVVGTWNNFKTNITTAMNIQTQVIGAISNVQSTVKNVQKAITSGITTVKDSIKSAKELFTVLKENPMVLVITLICLLVAAVMQAYQSNEGFRKTVDGIVKSVGSFLMPIIQSIQAKFTEVWNNVISPIYKMLQNYQKTIIEPIVEFLISNLVSAISTIVSVLQNLWNNVLDPLIKFLVSVFKPIFSDVFNGLGTYIEGLKQVFSGLIDFISGVFTGNWKKAFSGLSEIVSGVFTALKGLVSIPINLIIDGINVLIRGLDSLKISIPDWVPGFGGQTFGMNIPQIPHLARGGIIDSPTYAMIGEAGREAVVPLENNVGWIDALADKFASKLSSGGGEDINLTIPVYLDSSGSLVDTITKKINRKSRNNNASVFAY